MKRSALLFALLLLVLPQVTFAEEGNSDSMPPQTMELKKDVMMEGKADAMERKSDLTSALKEKREAKVANFQQKKQALKDRLQTVKDEKKKLVAENLDSKLDTINKNRTDRMSAHLTKLSEILSRLESKKIEAQTNGKDISAINAAMVTAEQAITTAETAVTAQAAKDYTAQVTDETTLRQNFSVVVTQLRTDLATTQRSVAAAKETVKSVAKAVSLIGTGETVTPQVTAVPAI